MPHGIKFYQSGSSYEWRDGFIPPEMSVLSLTPASSLKTSLALASENSMNNWSLSSLHRRDSSYRSLNKIKKLYKKVNLSPETEKKKKKQKRNNTGDFYEITFLSFQIIFNLFSLHTKLPYLLFLQKCWSTHNNSCLLVKTPGKNCHCQPLLGLCRQQTHPCYKCVLSNFSSKAWIHILLSSPAQIPCLSPSWFCTSIMRIFIRSILQVICWFIVLELQTNGIIFPACSALRIQHWFPSIVRLLDWHFWLIWTLSRLLTKTTPAHQFFCQDSRACRSSDICIGLHWAYISLFHICFIMLYLEIVMRQQN